MGVLARQPRAITRFDLGLADQHPQRLRTVTPVGAVQSHLYRWVKNLTIDSARNPAALRRWMEAYAALVSTDASFETIRDAATSNEGSKPSRIATKPYNDTLERLWVVDPVGAWLPSNNQPKRLTAPSKRHWPILRLRLGC